MQFTPANETEAMDLYDALASASYSLEEEAAMFERRGLDTKAARTRESVATLHAWMEQIDVG